MLSTAIGMLTEAQQRRLKLHYFDGMRYSQIARMEGVTETAAKKRTAEKHRRRITELDTLIERLYVDNISGKITDERYEKMSEKFEAEQAELTQALASLETEIAAEENQAVNVDRFLSVVRRYTEIETLTPAIVHEFIDRIIVHEPEQARGDRRQKVEIIYNNIGAVDRLALKGLGA
jgi:transposase